MKSKKDIIKKVEETLSEIRPYLQEDGGDISFVELTNDMTVKVKLIGACKTCEISMMTLKNGVEAAIKKSVPNIKRVLEIS